MDYFPDGAYNFYFVTSENSEAEPSEGDFVMVLGIYTSGRGSKEGQTPFCYVGTVSAEGRIDERVDLPCKAKSEEVAFKDYTLSYEVNTSRARMPFEFPQGQEGTVRYRS